MLTLKLNDLWCTPTPIIKSLENILGPFVLDAATSEDNPLGMERFLTPLTNALGDEPWGEDLTWCNSPYSQSVTWIDRMARETEKGCPLVAMAPLSWVANKGTRNHLTNFRMLPIGRIKFWAPPALQEYRRSLGLAEQPEEPKQDVSLYFGGPLNLTPRKIRDLELAFNSRVW